MVGEVREERGEGEEGDARGPERVGVRATVHSESLFLVTLSLQ